MCLLDREAAWPVNKKLENNAHRGLVMLLCTLDVKTPLILYVAKKLFFPNSNKVFAFTSF